MKYCCHNCGAPLRRAWTTKELRHLEKHFATTPTEQLALTLKRTETSVSQRAAAMGLKRDPDYLKANREQRWKIWRAVKSQEAPRPRIHEVDVGDIARNLNG